MKPCLALTKRSTVGIRTGMSGDGFSWGSFRVASGYFYGIFLVGPRQEG